MTNYSSTSCAIAPEVSSRLGRLEAIARAKRQADADDLALEAWLDRYPPGSDRPASWHAEHRRLMQAAEGSYGSYAELRAGTQ